MTTGILELQQPPRPQPAPTRDKLPEGWHFTERYGEVFVSPGGIAWTIKEVETVTPGLGNELKTVSVTVKAKDIVKKPAIEQRKQSILRNQHRKGQVVRTPPPNFGSGNAKPML